jgi:hypothetical protein
MLSGTRGLGTTRGRHEQQVDFTQPPQGVVDRECAFTSPVTRLGALFRDEKDSSHDGHRVADEPKTRVGCNLIRFLASERFLNGVVLLVEGLVNSITLAPRGCAPCV